MSHVAEYTSLLRHNVSVVLPRDQGVPTLDACGADTGTRPGPVHARGLGRQRRRLPHPRRTEGRPMSTLCV